MRLPYFADELVDPLTQHSPTIEPKSKVWVPGTKLLGSTTRLADLSSMAEQYEYEPLTGADVFRLFKFERQDYKGQLNGSMVTSSLCQLGLVYHALSYA